MQFRGTVSRDWECLQLVPIDGSEEFGVGGAYLKRFSTSFSCFNSIKPWFGGFQMQQFCEWLVTAADHSSISVLYMYDQLFSRCVTSWMKKSRVTSTVVRITIISNSLLSRKYIQPAWSISKRELVCCCQWSFAELLSNEKPPKYTFLDCSPKLLRSNTRKTL
jgi:hypothetical protein